MTASVTIGHIARETRRPTRTLIDGDTRRTVRVRPARTNARRQAIAESWGNR
ncbi:hypothetical protein ACIBCR_15420 [Micromonospora echinospora]|uniref:hypothetical protein n=1 Tax=Micromonospora echinospora TaxID=1877 RepID=UPI0037A7609C